MNDINEWKIVTKHFLDHVGSLTAIANIAGLAESRELGPIDDVDKEYLLLEVGRLSRALEEYPISDEPAE